MRKSRYVKSLFVLLLISRLHVAVTAQSTSANRGIIEVGFGFEVINYAGDLSEPDWDLMQTRPAAEVYLKWACLPRLQLGMQVEYGKLIGNDQNSRSHAERQLRFQNRIAAIAVTGEYALVRLDYDPVLLGFPISVIPHVRAGINGVVSHPFVTYYGNEKNLTTVLKKQLPETADVSRIHLGLLFGGGLSVLFGERWLLGLEGSFKPVFTDLLDGVSANGNPGARDWYASTAISVGYLINPARKDWR